MIKIYILNAEELIEKRGFFAELYVDMFSDPTFEVEKEIIKNIEKKFSKQGILAEIIHEEDDDFFDEDDEEDCDDEDIIY
ncbi:MAG: hypothetical protein ABII90_03875 [Bacteroidota bacterium]